MTRIPNTDQATSAEYPYTVGIPQVAQIGTTKYETLAEAIAAVPTTGAETTITMIANSAEPAVITVASGKNVVLDLNGKTVSYTTDAKSVYFITNEGTLTIEDNSANADGQVLLTAQPDTGYSKETVTIYNCGGTLTLASGTIKNATAGGLAYAVNNSSNAWGSDVVSTFNMEGGTVSAPSGDAALRVYQNCSASSTVLSKNYVNITGGTILDTGIFVDTNLHTANGSTEGFADSIDTQINISGGTVNGLIDLKTRHKNNTKLTITGGDFTNAKMWVRKYASEYKGDEPTEPMVYISGGKFAFIAGKAFGLAYDCGTSSWTTYEKPYAVSGGVFNVEVPATACAEGYSPAANTDAETMAAYPYTVAGSGYGGEVLPAAPVIDGNTITVTPQNIQYTLDGAYGSIDGKTIVLSEGAYPMLYFARATKYPASGTEYYKEQGETRYETIEEIQAHRNEWGTCHYNRTMQNVTLKPADGATVTIAGIECKSGHVYGVNQYDYLLDYGNGESGGSMYYLSQTVSGITFDGLTFTGKVNFETSASGDGYGAWHTTIAGVTFDGCTFTGSGTASSVGPALRYYSESATGYVSGLTVTDCTFENWYQGVYCNGVKDVTVTESEFDTTGHNAIAVQTQAAANVGEITITGNTFEKIGDRVIRFGNLASGTEITITGNTATNSGDSDGEVIKASGVADGIPVTMASNTWDQGAKSGSPEFGAAGIGTTYYMSIADAIAVANAQNIDEITILDGTSESPDSAWKVADGKLVRKVYVAQIVQTSEKYFTLAAAIAAAQDGDTVKLLSDIALTSMVTIDKSVKIDGNDKTITVTKGDANNYAFYFIGETAAIDCEFKNATIVSTGYQVAIMGNCDYQSTLKVDNVDITCDGECIYANGFITVNATGCEFRHNGMYATGKDPVYYSAIIVGYSGTINLADCAIVSFGNGVSTFPSGGTVTMSNVDIDVTAVADSGNSGYAMWVRNEDYTSYPEYCSDSVIIFESGSVKGSFKVTDTYTGDDPKNRYDARTTVSGGIFSTDPSAYVADGYVVLANEDVVTKDAYPHMVALGNNVTFELDESAPTGAAKPSDGAYAVGAALPLPTYTSTDTAFAGWKVAGTDSDVIMALPAGMTGGITLVATWTGVKTVTVDAGESKTPTIKVTDDWIAQNVTNEVSEATTEEIQTALNTTAANGLKTWENYVLGQSPTAKFSADAGQGAISAMLVTSSAQTPKVDTGFKVQYRLDKVTAGGDTESDADKGTAQDSDVIPLDLTKMEDTVAYYKTTAIITSTDENSGVSVEVPATNTIGVLKVANAPATAMIAVPWAALDGDGDISAANLVRTANLTVGDELHYYKNGKFQSWTLAADGTWQSTKNVSDSGMTDGDAASGAKIPRGSAVWLKRQDASKPVYLVGEVGTGTAKTALEGGTEKAPAWNMVASPSVEAVDVTKKVAAVAGDRIVIPTDGAPKNYTYKGGKWGYNKTEEVTINGQVGIRSVRVEVDALESTPGVGFWYLNAGADKNVDWTSEDDQGADAN